MTLERQILETEGVTYYSCRAPDSKYFLIAEPHKGDFIEKIESLQERWRDFMESVGFPNVSRCKCTECKTKRNCSQINFLPWICNPVQLKTNGLVILDFDCLTFGELILASDLLKDSRITIPTAYRLIIGLLTLVDRMVRMDVYADLTIENLLIDTRSSMVTLLDWSEADSSRILSIQKTSDLYRQAAEIIFTLTGAAQDEDNYWNCPAGVEDRRLCRLFYILQEVAQTQIEVPDGLEEAFTYIDEIRRKQKALIRTIVDSLEGIEFDHKKPLFEIVKLEKVEE